MKTIERVIQAAAPVLSVPVESIGPATSFKYDCGADSLTMVELVMALEEEFDIEFGEETTDIDTVRQLVAYIDGKLAPAS